MKLMHDVFLVFLDAVTSSEVLYSRNSTVYTHEYQHLITDSFSCITSSAYKSQLHIKPMIFQKLSK
jgi:hypothetical protein